MAAAWHRQVGRVREPTAGRLHRFVKTAVARRGATPVETVALEPVAFWQRVSHPS
jgi:hypothetical protein